MDSNADSKSAAVLRTLRREWLCVARRLQEFSSHCRRDDSYRKFYTIVQMEIILDSNGIPQHYTNPRSKTIELRNDTFDEFVSTLMDNGLHSA